MVVFVININWFYCSKLTPTKDSLEISKMGYMVYYLKDKMLYSIILIGLHISKKSLFSIMKVLSNISVIRLNALNASFNQIDPMY